MNPDFENFTAAVNADTSKLDEHEYSQYTYLVLQLIATPHLKDKVIEISLKNATPNLVTEINKIKNAKV